jgi:hypothetical protein
MPTDQPPPTPQDGRILSWLGAVKGLTVTNVLVIAMLVVVAIPAYFVWKALNDQVLLDRFLSNYRELSAQNVACAIREAKYRGGATQWSISTGFAIAGRDRYVVAVVMDYYPSNEELHSYCETLKLIADTHLSAKVVKEAQEERP